MNFSFNSIINVKFYNIDQIAFKYVTFYKAIRYES